MDLKRRFALLSVLAMFAMILAACGGGGTAGGGGLPKLTKAPKKVGFAQTESNNPWRLAQTASMQAEAQKRGYELVYTDAAGSAAKQVADVDSMIAQVSHNAKHFRFSFAESQHEPRLRWNMRAKLLGVSKNVQRPFITRAQPDLPV